MLAGGLFVACDLLDLFADSPTDSGGFGTEAFKEGTPDALLVVQSGLTLLAGLLLFGLIPNPVDRFASGVGSRVVRS